MQGSKSGIRAAPERIHRQRRYLTLLIWVVGICLFFGAYTVLINAWAQHAADTPLASYHSPASPGAPAVMKIDPASATVGPGEVFSVTVLIEDVINLGAFEFELTHHSTVLSATGVVSGPFLGSTGRNVIPVGPTYGTGSVAYGAFSLPPPNSGPNGDGVLATITFQTTFVGTSTLHLQNVIVTDPDGIQIPTSTEDGEVTVGIAQAPSVANITPNSGYSGQVLDNVIVAGDNFQAGASAQLTKTGQDPISASWLVVQSATRISCTLNLGKAVTGTWDVVVTNTDSQSGTLPNGFTVNSPPQAPPTITSITPDSGLNNGTVRITDLAGSDFRSGARVKLTRAGQSDILATNVAVPVSSQITCDLDLRGAFPGQWTVRVTNPDNQYDELANGFAVDGATFLPLVLCRY